MEIEALDKEHQRKKRKSRKERKDEKKKLRSQTKSPSRTAQQKQIDASAPSPSQNSTGDGKSSWKPKDAGSRLDYQSSYVPTPLPKSASKCIPESGASKSIGKWFPKAEKLKRETPSPTASCSILLFYQYAEPKLSNDRVEDLRLFLLAIGRHRPNLAGRIRIANEGLNCTLSAVDNDIDSSAAATLRHFSYDLQKFDADLFANTDFKFLDNLTNDRHFRQLVLVPVQELVFYGLDAKQAPLGKGGTHVSPQQFHELLANSTTKTERKEEQQEKKGTVVVDVRNHYEAAIGRFDGSDAVTYLDPKMRKSTDFASWLQESKPALEGKRVLMYCTGGIRCERASAHVKQVLGNEQEVYQLQGGIERYLQEFPDGGFWRGKNFTFDKREAISAANYNGDGGVVKKGADTASIAGCNCVVCQAPWDRYIGKKKCHTCGVPVLICEACLTGHRDRDPLSVRCPLCVEQNVTVKVEDVEWTKNGTKADTDGAAPSVLKWGGGHAKEKKRKRQLQRKSCKYGAQCKREDCFFSHPERV